MKGEVKVCPDCNALVSVNGDCACCDVCMLVECECEQCGCGEANCSVCDPNHDLCVGCDEYRDECACPTFDSDDQGYPIVECQYPTKPRLSTQAKCLCCNQDTQVLNPTCEIIEVDFKAKLVISRRSA